MVNGEMSDFGKGFLTCFGGLLLSGFIIVFFFAPFLNSGDQSMKPKLDQKTYTYFICHEQGLYGLPDLKHYRSFKDAEAYVMDLFESDNLNVAAYIKIFKVDPGKDWDANFGINRSLAIQRRLTARGFHVERVEYSEAEALKIEKTVWEWNKGNKEWIPRRETVTL